MQPAAQASTPPVWCALPSSSSGARYLRMYNNHNDGSRRLRKPDSVHRPSMTDCCMQPLDGGAAQPGGDIDPQWSRALGIDHRHLGGCELCAGVPSEQHQMVTTTPLSLSGRSGARVMRARPKSPIFTRPCTTYSTQWHHPSSKIATGVCVQESAALCVARSGTSAPVHYRPSRLYRICAQGCWQSVPAPRRPP